MKPLKTNFPAKMPKGRPHYYEQVWELVRLCPAGRVTTYGAIADALTLGTPRMSGYAMRHSFAAEPPVPAHRVVNRIGDLTGRNHFPDPSDMAAALRREGVEVKNDRVVDFKLKFWDPATA
ncbi:MAG: MGMT family protein [Saprospiraceae bacterium]